MSSQPQNIDYSVAGRDFKYYIFDWDDNILHMPTRIHLERLMPDGSWLPHAVSTAAFPAVRGDLAHYRAPNGDWEQAFIEFRDSADASESKFIDDTREAIRKVQSGELRPGPSFETLRQTLREGRLFAIVTARGHAPSALRQAVRLFIDTVLSPAEREEMLSSLRGYRVCFDHVSSFGTDEEEIGYYLSLCRYHAVTSPMFKQWMKEAAGPRAASAEEPAASRLNASTLAKRFAIRDFVEHVISILERTGADSLRRPISVGFSDDDARNVAVVEDYIQTELSKKLPGVKFCVYDTSDPALSHGRKITVAGQRDFGF